MFMFMCQRRQIIRPPKKKKLWRVILAQGACRTRPKKCTNDTKNLIFSPLFSKSTRKRPLANRMSATIMSPAL
jgi:hypothetical protein